MGNHGCVSRDIYVHHFVVDAALPQSQFEDLPTLFYEPVGKFVDGHGSRRGQSSNIQIELYLGSQITPNHLAGVFNFFCHNNPSEYHTNLYL